ncbi:hypothetical protein JW906_16275 [bacterium]|nr:hypothetical protein [bacterium]
MRGFRSALCAVLLVAGSGFGQPFYRSQGLELFNRGNFEEAIPAMTQWTQEHESEKGIALYYIGESHYNLGLISTRDPEQKEHFVQAMQNLSAALQQPDLGDPSNDLTAAARYKLAWCHFRLSELNENPLIHLRSAASRFGELRTAPDTLSVIAGYMAGESLLRAAVHQRRIFSLSRNTGEAVGLAANHQLALREAEASFRQVAESPLSSKRLALCSRIRLQDIAYERGELVQGMPVEVWTEWGVGQEAGPLPESRRHFESADYGSVLSAFPGPLSREFRPAILYSETQKNLNLFLLTGEDRYVRSFNALLDSLRWTSFQTEKLFFQGNRDQRQNSRSEDFQRLATPSRSHYAKAASTLPEALYWLAWVQFVANVEGSDSFFEQFLEKTRQSAGEDRIDYLREDARYRILLIRFDRYAADKNRLRTLRDDIQAFRPAHSEIASRKELLLQLVRIGLDEPIWGQVLQAANTDARLDEAFILIRNMLVRASIVTGKERLQYLSYLDRLFQITQERRSVETTFYKGMALFLRAEIQENAAQKRRLFHSAAELLSDIQDPYRQEGEYIQARSYFSSAKHELKESERFNVFDRSEPLFIRLINQARSVRSLYYLGEIFRIRGNDRAARKCYEHVMQVTRNQAGGEFWFNNARAGWATCKAAGDTSLLRDIRISSVEFPERLLTIQGEEISLEKFADTDFIRNQYWEEALTLLLKFRLPRRDLYPSVNVPASSRFARRSFDFVSAGLDERIGAVYSGLRLTLLYPENVPKESLVRLNGIPLDTDSRGEFRKSPIALGEVIEIRVEHPLCYPFVKSHAFLQPGIQDVVAPLVEKQNYVPSQKAVEGIQVIHFPDRIDGNRVVITSEVPVSTGSPLYRDFTLDISLRDFAYSGLIDGFAAVHARKDELRIYRSHAGSVPENLPLTYAGKLETLGSAEGIAVDLSGHFYVVDWTKHRVLVVQPDGTVVREWGSFGFNAPEDAGKPIKLCFPTRIALAEDRTGVPLWGKSYFRPPVVYILDREGIHLVSSEGIYWDTLKPGFLDKGAACSIGVSGYGSESKLYLVNHQNGGINGLEIAPEP